MDMHPDQRGDQNDPSLPQNELEQVIAVCRRFEAAWKAAEKPAIEEHLASVAPHLRSRLFLDLLTIELKLRRSAGETLTADDYVDRFPEFSKAIMQHFASSRDPQPGSERRSSASSQSTTERDLLFGLFAFQNGFIDRTALLAAFNTWALNKTRPIAELLVENGALSRDTYEALQTLVTAHLKDHGNDPHQSLAAVTAVSAVQRELEQIDDVDLRTMLATAAIDSDGSEATVTFREGTQTGSNDRFRVLRFHAQGGLGEVFVARDEELGREVALKRIRARADHPESRSRFVLEAEITGGLEHPNIVPIYSLGHDPDGRPFYAMRFIQGDSLRSAISSLHRSTPKPDPNSVAVRELIGRFIDVCQAIAYAHKKGVVHRDLKPGNIILGQYGETLLIDWGLAKVLGQASDETEGSSVALVASSGSDVSPTSAGSRIGTPAFMSPEQARGDLGALGPATDVYGLGATLCSLLTGKPPVSGADTDEILERVCHGDLDSPRSINPKVSRALHAICVKALASKPEDRYSSADALADDLECWLADEPVSALPESAWQQFGRWTRRHRKAAIAGVLVLAAISLVSTLAAVMINQARHAEQRSLAKMRKAFQTANEQISAYPEFVSDYAALQEENEAVAGLRSHLLDQAFTYYQTFISEHEDDEDLGKEVASAYDRLGLLRAERGEKLGALEDLEASISRWEALTRLDDRDEQSRHGLAIALENLGSQYQEVGRREEAQQAYERSIGLYKSLITSPSEDPDYQYDLASLEDKLATLLARHGLREEAREHYERAEAIYTRLVRGWPDRESSTYGFASLSNNFGIWCAQQGQYEDAGRSFRRAVELMHELVKSRPDEARYRYRLAGNLVNLARLSRDLGNLEEAQARNEGAIEQYKRLVEDFPGLIRYRSSLAHAFSNYANFLRDTGQVDLAEQNYTAAIEAGERLREEQPNVPDHRNVQARIYNNRGRLQESEDRLEDALESYTKSRDLRQGLVDDFPEMMEYRHGLGLSENGLGTVYSKLDRSEEAEDCFNRAVAHFQHLLDDNSKVTSSREGLAWSYFKLGWLRLSQERPAEASAYLKQTIEIWQRLVQDDPEVFEFRNVLGGALNDLALARHELGEHQQALENFQEAVRIQKQVFDANPQMRRYREYLSEHYRGLAKVLRHLDRVDEAAAATRERVKLWPNHPSEAYSAAKDLALCVPMTPDEAGADRMAVDAVAALEQAIAAGFSDAAQIENDSELDPLRDRGDFQRLIGELPDATSPVEPAAP